MRDHDPVVFEEFGGWYKRGDADSTPPDHFVDATNISYIDSGFKTRDGIEPWLPDVGTGSRSTVRMYKFSTDLHHGVLALDSNRNIYFLIPDINTQYFVLHVDEMTDFSFVSYNNFAFISPGLIDSELGIPDEFVYVYDGTSTPARKAAGVAPTDTDGAMAAANGGAGNVESGIHIFGVVYETVSGFLTKIGPDTLPTVTAGGTTEVDLSAIPVSSNIGVVVARHIVASKSIDPTLYTGDTRGYELFFVPDGTIDDNITTTLSVNFYDIELLESAAYLFDIMEEIPSAGGLGTYHNRLIAFSFPEELSTTAYLSQPGEPEAMNALDGLISLPRDASTGITCAQEYRDILYLFKADETRGYSDNGDVPSSWIETIVDNQIGCGKHGMARRGEYSSINIEYLLLLSIKGIFIFNGTFQRPEMSFKIEDFWINTAHIEDRSYRCECYNDVKNQIIYINIPRSFAILVGNYKNGFDPLKIRWSLWVFNIEPTTMTLFSTAREQAQSLLVGSNGTDDGTI